MDETRRRAAGFLFSLVAYAAFGASLLYLIGFLANFSALPVTVDRGSAGSAWLAAAADAGLIVLFGVQHSVMARRSFKRWCARFLPTTIERSTYVLVSSVLTFVLCVAWQPIPYLLWSANSAIVSTLWWGVFAGGVVLLVAASFQIDHWELLGLRQTWSALRKKGVRASEFSANGLYRLVRHPIYLGWLLMFWVTPVMSVGRLLLATGMTIYTLIALRFEERDLVREHGEQYVRYRERVPVLLPHRSVEFHRWVRHWLIRSLAVLVIVGSGFTLATIPRSASAGGTTERLTLHVGGRERAALVVSPSGETRPRRLVLMMHGAGGDAERIRRFTAYGLERLAARAHWVVAYPEGVGGTWNDCRQTPAYPAKQLGIDDVEFLSAVIGHLRSSYGIEASDVLVAGFSNGGQMAIRLAVERPDSIGAIAVFAAQLPAATEWECPTEIPAVRSLWVNGTRDPFVPPGGGGSFGPGGADLGRVRSVTATVDAFLAAFPHTSVLATRRLAEVDGNESTYVTETDWGYPNAIVLRQLVLHGSGHVVPQREVPLPSIAGPSAGDADAAEVIAEFLEDG